VGGLLAFSLMTSCALYPSRSPLFQKINDQLGSWEFRNRRCDREWCKRLVDLA
jgi:hypothetical protein